MSPQDLRESLAQQHASVPMRKRTKKQEPPEAAGQLVCVDRDETDPFQTVRKARTDSAVAHTLLPSDPNARTRPERKIKNQKCKQRNQVDDSKCQERREAEWRVAEVVGDGVTEVFSESVSKEETPVLVLNV